jgi:hypothetical protein
MGACGREVRQGCLQADHGGTESEREGEAEQGHTPRVCVDFLDFLRPLYWRDGESCWSVKTFVDRRMTYLALELPTDRLFRVSNVAAPDTGCNDHAIRSEDLRFIFRLDDGELDVLTVGQVRTKARSHRFLCHLVHVQDQCFGPARGWYFRRGGRLRTTAPV